MTEQTTSVGHTPRPRWEFDASVADCFEDMLRRSIPQYDVMRRLLFDVASRYVVKGTDVVDLGSSRGDAIAGLLDRFGCCNRFVAAEVSPPMLEVLRARFSAWIEAGVVSVQSIDLRNDYPKVHASLTLSVFTLMFVPFEYRPRLLAEIYDHLRPDGALVVAEKLIGRSGHTDELMTDLYVRHKRESGYTEDDIARKRLSLEGVLVPTTAPSLESSLRETGFRYIECVWRWCNFAAWVAVK